MFVGPTRFAQGARAPARGSPTASTQTPWVSLDRVSVPVSGRLDLRGFFAVDEGVRPGFKDISTTVKIDSPAPADEIERRRAMIDRHCPVLAILRCVMPVKTRIELSATAQKPAA